ncbi:PIN domain-containing protein [uncultured Thiothrix sp.]|jgi:predicted nucleic acid-binding protein|uniref:type II toxin-antitoxin system VapC family toxin n=1 Tax=uncultured Thiothrix sp. TaxID=223185 RepID=UPI00262B23C4|nr:PIN domain-containing protein [uncultured Thiothrix sp.]HMT91678.1 PIN domain-containing protein [Thiolinea sp.]
MSSKILIDTCGWIDFLRSREGQLGNQVEQALMSDRAVLCSVSIAELLQGAKGQKEKQQLSFLFEQVECLAVLSEDWFAAGNTLQNLRSQGITLPLTDALIAAVANRHQLPVLTIDGHFQHLSVKRL